MMASPGFSAGVMVGQIDQICTLLKNTPYAPYAAYSRSIAKASLEQLLRDRVGRLLRDPCSSGSFGADRRSFACWRRLDWDTRMFGMSAARLEYLVAHGAYGQGLDSKNALLDAILEQCRAARVRHLTARVDAGDLSSMHALERSGFQLLDGIQTFSMRLTRENVETRRAAGPYEVRLVCSEDIPALVEIARTAYVFDRFHADSALSPDTADRVNEEWLRNSCLGTAADATVVACRNEVPVAYVTCKIDWETREVLDRMFGTIVLVATAEEERGRGAARAATAAALDWFAQQGVDTVEVGTQIRNVPAGRLYETCGFRLVGTSLTFRALL